MDDSAFQKWSEALVELRAQRETDVANRREKDGDAFGPADFFDMCMGSLDQTMEAWFKLEQPSWQNHPSSDPSILVETTRAEMESIFDFELDAILSDMQKLRTELKWDSKAFDQAKSQFDSFTAELRKKYQLKVNSLTLGSSKKKWVDPVAPTKQVQYSGGGGSSAMGVIVALFLGLFLGGGPSIFYWDKSKNVEKNFVEEKNRMMSQRRELQEQMTLLQETLEQLATGKLKNIQDIEREITRIRVNSAERKQTVEREYTRNREKMLKRMTAGDQLDRALENLAEEKRDALAALQTQEATELESLNKQRNKLKDLMQR